MIRVALDAGHNQLTAGKRSFDGKFREYEFNLDIANRVHKILSLYDGIESQVFEVVIADQKAELNERIKLINLYKPDISVSFHANAYGTVWNDAHGMEIYCSKGSVKGALLAESIHKQLLTTGLTDRGVKETDELALCIRPKAPAVLIEHFFYSNKDELAKYNTEAARQKFAECDARGILNYLGIAWKDVPTKTELKPEHWGMPYLRSLVKKGLIANVKDHENTLDQPITEAEVFAIIDRATNK